MAPKGSMSSDKRKSSSGEKSDGPTKKQKRSKKEPSSDPEDSDPEDPEDGGARLAGEREELEKKGGGPGNSSQPRSAPGQALEKGRRTATRCYCVDCRKTPLANTLLGANSREAHAKQKQLARERKAAKPLAEELVRAKKIWERLRQKKCDMEPEARRVLVDDLFGILSGRMRDFVLKHDANRIIQALLVYSTPEQRTQIAEEFNGAYAQLIEGRYSRFLVGKLLARDDPEVRGRVIPEFYGNVWRLINHRDAAWLLDDIYRNVATEGQRAALLREWYGTEFAILNRESAAADPKVTANLSEILEEAPSKRSLIMKGLLDKVNSLIQKQKTGFTMLHDAMLQYYLNLKPDSEEQAEFTTIIKESEDGIFSQMAFSQSGARLVCLLLAHGSAKERKQYLKAFKASVKLMARDPHAHVVILAAYDLIDDTVLTSKAIFPELLGDDILSLANDIYARTSLLYLFEGQAKSLFPASHSADLDILGKIHEIRKTTSKKDNETRRTELVAAASPQLLAAIKSSPEAFASTSFGCQLLTSVLLSAVGDKSEVLRAVASMAAGDPKGITDTDEEESGPPKQHISQMAFGCKMLKTLVAGGRFDKVAGKVQPVSPPLNFSDMLFHNIDSHIVAWATGPSSFVPLALLEAEDFTLKAELKALLLENKMALERAATEETPEKKAALERAATKKAPGQKAKKKRAGPNVPVGNVGARLLLEKLQGL